MPIGYVTEILNDRPKTGRLMGLDQGDARIGVAVSDPVHTLASAVETVKRVKFKIYVQDIKKIWDEFECAGFIIGWPLNMDGSEGPRCDSVRDFALNLKQSGLFGDDPWIGLQDERLSTSAVQDFLIDEVDMNRKRRSQVVDKLAAQYILQSALDRMG